MEASTDAVEIDDVEGNVVYVNDSWCRLFEQERLDVTGKHWAHLKHANQPQSRAALEETWERALKEGGAQGVFSFPRPGDKLQHVSLARTLYSNAGGVETALITFYRPTTIPFEPSPLLIALLNRRRDEVVVLDSIGHIVTANQAFSNLTGYHSRDLVGLDIRDLITGAEEVLDQTSQEFTTWMAGSVDVIRKDGTPQSLWMKFSTAKDACGNIVGFVGRASPNSDLLESDYQERKLRHDLNNMFTAVLGIIELMGRGVIEDETMRKRLAHVQSALTRCQDILEQMAT